MQVKQENSRRRGLRARQLASLSALGAAALTTAVGRAEATVQWTDLPADDTVGLDNAASTTVAFPLDAAQGLVIKGSTNTFRSGPIRNYARGIAVAGTGGAVTFRKVNTSQHAPGSQARIAHGPAGLFMSHVGTASTANGAPVNQGVLASIWLKKSFGQTRTPSGLPGRIVTNTFIGSYPDGLRQEDFGTVYTAFKFLNSSTNQVDYGWLEYLVDNGQNQDGLWPEVTLLAVGYDDCGNPITTGQTGGTPACDADTPPAVPEPGSLSIELTALGALVLGSAGVRRWRAARQAR